MGLPEYGYHRYMDNWLLPACLFALTSAALALRLGSIARDVRRLADSVESRESVLLEKRPRLGTSRSLARLHNAVNALIGEARMGRSRDLDYLRQIELTLSNIREAVLIIDENHYVRMANTAAQSLFGVDKPVQGRRIEGLLPGAGFLEYVGDVLGKRRMGSEVVNFVLGSRTIWFEVTGSFIEGAGAGRQLCLFVLHDITKLKALENMRTDFVANVSHELRTPVTVIRGFTDTLLDEGEDLDPTQRRSFLLKIQRNVVRLISLLEDLLTLSRLEGRALKLELEQLQLNDLVKETVESIDERLPEGCSLALELDPELPQTAIDPLRIGQVLENLLNNAIRHAKGMKTLRVRTYIEQSRVTCAVEDDGCGIPLADLPHIFERFYRVDKGRSRESGGTGLGLSIVKHIVMQHGGNIFVSSRVGEGSRFGFTLPLRQVKDMDNESASN